MMTTNIVVYCYTVTQDKYILKLTKHHLLRFSKYFLDMPRVIFIAFNDRVITQIFKRALA